MKNLLLVFFALLILSSCKKKEENIAVDSVTIDKGKTDEVRLGKTLQLKATVLPENATSKEVVWKSSDPSKATVSEGLVTPVKEGETIISATAGGITANCTVKVLPPFVAVAGISVDYETVSIVIKKTSTVRAIITPDNASDKRVEWSSDKENIATVNKDSGVITAMALGTCTITAKSVGDPTKTATCAVTVVAQEIPVNGILIDPKTANILVNSTHELTVIFDPETTTNKNVAWSTSASSIAEVAPNGVVTARSVGTATITASVGSPAKTAICAITVTNLPVAVTGISVVPVDTTVIAGAAFRLRHTITPTDATNGKVKYVSNDDTKAIVSERGQVTSKAPGAVTITVTSVGNTNETATCSLTIKRRVESIIVVPDVVTLSTGQKQRLSVTVSPSDATDKTVTWSSASTSKATVSNDGEVTAGNTPGEVEITATAKDGSAVTGKATVTVIPVATAITITPANPTVGTGKTTAFTVNVTPNNASKAVIWTSSDPLIAAIDATTGVATSAAVGSATITATATDGSGLAPTTTLTVRSSDASVSAITLGTENFSLAVPAEGATTTVANIPRTVAANGFNSITVNITTGVAEATIKIGTAAFTQGQAVNFSSAVTFTVTAPDGITVKNYTVAITPYNKDSNPYGIYTVKHLVDVGNGLGNNYLVKNDINLPNNEAAGAVELTRIGDYAEHGWQPLGSYNGELFDGGGYSINNFYFNRSGERTGLFELLDDYSANIKNLGVNCRENTTSKGGKYTGILVGYNNQGNIYNCFTTGKVESYNGDSGESYAGGLVGYMVKGNINTSYSTAIVSAPGGRESCAGGLVGYIYGDPSTTPNIQNCYATGDVSSSGIAVAGAGGLVGWTKSGVNITNCYATGSISSSRRNSATAYTGGLVGGATFLHNSKVNPRNSYRNSGATLTKNGTVVTVSDDPSNGDLVITPKTYAEMQTDPFKDLLKSGTINGSMWGRADGKNNNLPYITGVGVGK